MTQAQLATALGLTQPAVAQWEAGAVNPRPSLRKPIATVLDTPVDYLFPSERVA